MVFNVQRLFTENEPIVLNGAIAYTKVPVQRENELFQMFPEDEYYISRGSIGGEILITKNEWNTYTKSFQCTDIDISFYSNPGLYEMNKTAYYKGDLMEYSYVCNSTPAGVLAKIIEFSQKKCFVSSGTLSGCIACEIVFPKFFKSLFFHVGGTLTNYPLEEKCRDLWNGILCMLPKLNQQNGFNIPDITRTEETMPIRELNRRIVQMINNKNVYEAMGYMNINLFYNGENETLVQKSPSQSAKGKYTVMNYTHTENGMLLSTYYNEEFSAVFMKNLGIGTPYHTVNRLKYEKPKESPQRKKKGKDVL